MTRLEAAERAVVPPGPDLTQAMPSPPPHAAALDAMKDPLHRLRDLREKHAEEECGEMHDRYATDMRPSTIASVPCHLPRGHAGAHEGDLGVWRWE